MPGYYPFRLLTPRRAVLWFDTTHAAAGGQRRPYAAFAFLILLPYLRLCRCRRFRDVCCRWALVCDWRRYSKPGATGTACFLSTVNMRCDLPDLGSGFLPYPHSQTPPRTYSGGYGSHLTCYCYRYYPTTRLRTT